MRSRLFVFLSLLLLLTLAYGDVSAYFSPYDNCEAVWVNTLKTARSTVDISCFGISDHGIADELIDLQTNHHVRVRVCEDLKQSALKSDLHQMLIDSGIEVIIKPITTLEHNKFGIVDAGQPDAAVLTGSWNLSRSAQSQDNNLLLITKDKPTTDRFEAAFVRIHNRDKNGKPKTEN